MSRRLSIGQPAPRFTLPMHGSGSDSWSLDDHLGDLPVVVVFHRHIH